MWSMNTSQNVWCRSQEKEIPVVLWTISLYVVRESNHEEGTTRWKPEARLALYRNTSSDGSLGIIFVMTGDLIDGGCSGR